MSVKPILAPDPLNPVTPLSDTASMFDPILFTYPSGAFTISFQLEPNLHLDLELGVGGQACESNSLTKWPLLATSRQEC